MLRSTITTHDGLRFLVEAENPNHLLKILERVSNGHPVGVQLNENVDTVQHVTINKSKSVASKDYRRGYTPKWSKKDILAVANLVRSNSSLKSGVTSIVKKYLRTHGDCKKRSDATLYTIVSEYRKYFAKGDVTAIPKKTKRLLDENGLYPVGNGNAYVASNTANYLGNVHKVKVVEA